MKILVFIVLLIFPSVLDAQILEGKVLNEKSQPISYTTVSIKNQKDSVLNVVYSNAGGNFKIEVSKSNHDSIFIYFEHISYQPKKVKLTDFQKTSTIYLESKKDLLDEVVVKSRPLIKQNGDTTIYNVESFANESDRSIGDVMNRMPGMQYTDDGKIFYNGKRVNNLLVEGDKILGNNIKLGGDAIQKDQVKDVEVISDYHDKKINKGKVESDELAVNLKLKENLPLKINGINQVGIGIDGIYDVQSDLTSFNHSFKLISSSSANNLGKNKKLDGSENAFLNGNSIGRPSIDLNRYYNNQTWHHSSVISKKLWNKVDFSTGINFFADKEIFGNKSEQKYLLENDQYLYTEDQISRNKPLMASLETKFEVNETNHFFKNETKLHVQQNQIETSSNLNGNTTQQEYLNKFLKIQNQLDYDKNLKKGYTMSTSWNFNSQQGKENLWVSPNISLENWKNKDLNQSIKLPNWNSKLSWSISKSVQKYTYSLKIEHEYIDQSLFSTLSDHEQIPIPLWLNELRWKQNRVTINPNIYRKSNKISWSIAAPIVNGNWNIYDSVAKFADRPNRWFIQPRVMLNYEFSNQHYIRLVSSYNKSFEGIETMYRNPILTSYRTLEQKLNTLNYKNSFTSILDWKYTNVRKFLFLNGKASYFSQMANFIISSRLTENGMEHFTVAQENKLDQWEISGGIGKLFQEIQTNVHLNLRSNWAYYNQLLNGQNYPYLQQSMGLDLSITKDLGPNTTLTTNWIMSESSNSIRNKSLNIPTTKFTTNKLETKLVQIIQKKMFITANWKFHHVNQSNSIQWGYHFVDASIRYKINKKYEFELIGYNLTNVRRFETFSLNSIIENRSIYQLRGRMALLKFNFSF